MTTFNPIAPPGVTPRQREDHKPAPMRDRRCGYFERMQAPAQRKKSGAARGLLTITKLLKDEPALKRGVEALGGRLTLLSEGLELDVVVSAACHRLIEGLKR